MRSAGAIASFVFELDAYCVNGHAAQAKAAAAPIRGPPRRRPTSARPRSASRSKRIDVKWTEGSLSHLWLQPKTRYPGMYARYDTGPYVSPSGFAVSQMPFVWTRSRTSPEESA